MERAIEITGIDLNDQVGIYAEPKTSDAITLVQIETARYDENIHERQSLGFQLLQRDGRSDVFIP